MSLLEHGITTDTPKNLLFSSGVFYKNLTYTAPVTPATAGTWSGTILGATSGGGKLSITPEYADAELDGANVKVKGAKFKVGESAQMEATMTEIAEGIIKDALHLVEDTTFSDGAYKKFDTQRNIADADYLTNIAFVGTLTSGKQVIVIMENALCTSALELEGKNKTQATYSCVFECHAPTNQADLNHLPVHIYFPKAQQQNNNENVPNV